MFPLRDVLIRIVLLYSMCGFVQSAHAITKGAPLPGPLPVCPSGPPYALREFAGVCIPTDTSTWLKGLALWPAGQGLSSVGNTYTLSSLDDYFVPHSGEYKMRSHWCASSSIYIYELCNLSKSIQTVDSSKSVNLSSATSIGSQNPNFGGGAGGTLSAMGNLCLTFVDVADGQEYTVPDKRFCGGGGITPLPDRSSMCTINNNNALNVDMGTLERKDIIAYPGRSPTTVSKTIPVTCTGDSSLTMTIKFSFSEMPINGSSSTLIGTNIPGLGIAISYNDHVIQGPSDTVTETFKTGLTNIKLEFEAARDPTLALKDIATGDFTASAIMVMTQN